LTVELVSAGVTALDVDKDIDSAKEKIQSFVDTYNEVVSTIRDLTKYGGEAGGHGALLSDSAVFGMDIRVRSIIGSSSNNGGDFSSLMDVGFASDSKSGQLKLDMAELEKALKTDFDSVGDLVSDYAGKLDDYVKTQLDSDGVISTRTDGLDSRMEDIGKQRDALEMRMESVRTRYTKQFTRLDGMIASLNSTGNFLAQQLASLPGARSLRG